MFLQKMYHNKKWESIIGVEKMKNQVIALLSQVKRPGMDRLIQYLEEKTDYFTAPASTQHHGCYECGLIDHSLTVYSNLVTIVKTFLPEEKISKDSLIIVALLHDLCKVNFYRKALRNRKNEKTGQWEKVEIYEIHDQFPVGHGEKSVMILQKYIQLTEDEIMAIRWHMAGFDDSARGYAGSQSLSRAMKSSKLVVALQMADLASSYFNEK